MSEALFWICYGAVAFVLGLVYVWTAHRFGFEEAEPLAMLAFVWPVILPVVVVTGGFIYLGKLVSERGDRARERAFNRKRERIIAEREVERVFGGEE